MIWNVYLCRFLLDSATPAEIKNDIQTMRTLKEQSHGAERRQGLSQMIILYESRLTELTETV